MKKTGITFQELQDFLVELGFSATSAHTVKHARDTKHQRKGIGPPESQMKIQQRRSAGRDSDKRSAVFRIRIVPAVIILGAIGPSRPLQRYLGDRKKRSSVPAKHLVECPSERGIECLLGLWRGVT